MKVKIYIDWEKDCDIERERAAEIAQEILKKDYPIDIVIEQF